MLTPNPHHRLRMLSHSPAVAVVGVGAAALLSVLSRLPFLGLGVFPDEGGYLLIAEHWSTHGPSLYGHLWVDRPPLLILFWRLADLAGGIEAARLFACLLAVLLTVSAGWTGALVAGRRGALSSSLVAAALVSTPLLGGREIDGELIAAPLVMVSVAMALMAARPSRRMLERGLWSLASGIVGAAAVLVKQNFVDALIFAAVLLVVSAVRGHLPRPVAGVAVATGVSGAAIPFVATIVWARGTAAGVSGFWYALYGFRSAAGRVIAAHSMNAPDVRLVTMLGAAWVSGLLVLVGAYLWCFRRSVRSADPVTLATLAMLTVGVVGVALGGSYWMHYLMGLTPVAAVAAGALANRVDYSRLRHVSTVVVLASSIVATTASAVATPLTPPAPDVVVSQLLRSAGHRTDSVVVAYGQPNVIEESGLRPAYPYLWSLPMRTLDPHLDVLVGVLSGRSAATWVVVTLPLDSWGIDSDGRLRAAISEHYRLVSDVCGIEVYLHRGRHRTIPDDIACGAPLSLDPPMSWVV